MSAKSILIEATPATDNHKTGIGYYVDNMLITLNNSKIAKNYTIFYYNFLGKNKFKNPYNNLRTVTVKFTPAKLIGVFKKFGSLPYIDVFVKKSYKFILYTNYVALPSINKTPYGIIIYDMGFLDKPQYIQQKNLNYLQSFAPKTIKNASLIVTISDFTKERILHYYPNIKAKIIVTPIPAKSIKYDDNKIGNSTQNTKYILAVGTLEPRKNYKNLVLAYCRLPQNIKDKYQLIVAGVNGWDNKELLLLVKEKQNRGNNIKLTGYVTDQELKKLYKDASVFIMPSHYEGFGMPLLEAMQNNLPMAISDIKVFHEIAQDSAIYFNKDDPNDIANNLTKLINSPDIQKQNISRYAKILSSYSWENNISLIDTAINDLLKERN